MKRIAVLLVAVAATFVAAPAAHADKPQECVTIPALPGSCLDQATADYIAGLQASNQTLDQDRKVAEFEVSQLRPQVSALLIENAQIQMVADNATATLTNVEWNLARAEARAERRLLTITALRAKVKELRLIIRNG